MTSLYAIPDRYPYQNEPIWSRPEKAIVRKAFDAALQRELHEVMQETKRIANRIMQPSDLRDMEHYRHNTGKRLTVSTTIGPRASRTCSGNS
jgi:hypothetical protein